MRLMKFVVNNPHQFDTIQPVYLVVTINCLVMYCAELLNIYLLSYQKTVDFCIAYFVSFKILLKLPGYFGGSLVEDKLKAKIFEEMKVLKYEKKGSEINFWKDRDALNKIMRLQYKFNRMCYIGVIFYF